MAGYIQGIKGDEIMYQCDYCGETFLSFDEYNQHMLKHFIGTIQQLAKIVRELGDTMSELNKLVAELNQRYQVASPVYAAAPPELLYPFEVMQLAICALSSSKTSDDVIKICDELNEKLTKRK